MPHPTHRRRAGTAVRIVGLVALLGVGGIGAAVLAKNRSTAVERPATADLVTASTTSFEITTTATGELEARNQISLRNEVESDVSIVEIIPEGTLVKKGDLVIQLTNEQIKTEIDEAMQRVESARAERTAAVNAYQIQQSENDSKFRQADLKVRLAELSLKQWQEGEVKQKRKDLETAFQKAERDLTRLEDKVKQNIGLLDKGYISKDESEQEIIRKLEAEAALAKAILDRETYENYQYFKDAEQKQSDVTEAKAELERVQAEAEIHLASKDADRINRNRQLGLAEERLAKHETQLKHTTIIAPSDGLVVYATSRSRDFDFGNEGPLRVGRRVYPNEELVILPDTSAMNATVRVHESLAGRVRPGLPASVKVDAVGGKVFSGKIVNIGVLAESGGWRDPNRREYTVRIELENSEDSAALKPSMRCEAQIQLGRIDDAIAVPVQAVFSDGPVRFVYTPQGARFARVPVAVGARSDTLAQISGGLNDGQRVLVRQPTPAEILQQPWTEAQLTLVGLKFDEQGNPVPANNQAGPNGDRMDRRAERGNRGDRSGNRPGRDGPPGPREPVEQAASETEAKPDGATDSGAPSTEDTTPGT